MASPPSPPLKVVCAWCGDTIRDGPPHPVSHGICAKCEAQFRQEEGLDVRKNPIGPHTMLGRGGKLRTPQSESGVIEWCVSQLSNHALPNMVARDSEGIKYSRHVVALVLETLKGLKEQVASGYHRNPAITIFGNPPAGRVMTKDVQAILYHRGGKDYCHGFGDADITLKTHRDGGVTIGNLHQRTGVEALAMPDGSVVLRHPSHAIWDER